MSDYSSSTASASRTDPSSYLDILPDETKLRLLQFVPESTQVAVAEGVPSMRGCVFESLRASSALQHCRPDDMPPTEFTGRLLAARSHLTSCWNDRDLLRHQVDKDQVSVLIGEGERQLLAFGRGGGVLDLVDPISGEVAHRLVHDRPDQSFAGVAVGMNGRIVAVRKEGTRCLLEVWNPAKHRRETMRQSFARVIRVRQSRIGNFPLFVFDKEDGSQEIAHYHSPCGPGSYSCSSIGESYRACSKGYSPDWFLAGGLKSGRISLERSVKGRGQRTLSRRRLIDGHYCVPLGARWTLAVGEVQGSSYLVSALNNELKVWDLSASDRGRFIAETNRQGRGVISAMTIVPFPGRACLLLGTSKGDIELWTIGPEGLYQERSSHVSSKPIDELELFADGRSPAVMLRTGERVQVLDLLKYEPDDHASAPSKIASDVYERSRTSGSWKLALATSALALALLGIVGVGRLTGRKLIPVR